MRKKWRVHAKVTICQVMITEPYSEAIEVYHINGYMHAYDLYVDE